MTYREIRKLVEKVSGIKDLSDKSRTRELSDARFVYYALCMKYVADKEHLIISNEMRSIGLHVKRDRTSVIHGLKMWHELSRDNCWHGKWLYKLCVEVEKNDLRNALLDLQWKPKKEEIEKCPPVEFEIVK